MLFKYCWHPPDTCFFVEKGNSNQSSLDKNVIQVVKSRLYVASLIVELTQKRVDQQLLI